MSSLVEAMRALLDAPLSLLIDPRAQVRATAVAEQWDLPEPDLLALQRFGLPQGPMLRPSPQAQAQPVLTPNVAGERERRLTSPDQQLYLLGIYGSDSIEDLTIRVGAAAGNGRVLGIRRRPATIDDIHPQLRSVYPHYHHPAVCYFNSSVAAFVEVSWRWRAAVELLKAHPGPPPTADLDQHDEHDEEVQQSRASFMAGMTQIDPTLGDPDLSSIWVETITENH